MKRQPTDISRTQSAAFLDDLVAVVREEKQREAELARALKMEEEARRKEDFIMSISYAMRTPLNMIMGFTQVLSEMGDTLAAEEKVQMGEHIRKGADTLTEVLNAVLQFTRLESGRVQMSAETTDVAQLVREVVEEHLGAVQEGVALTVAEGRSGVAVTGDRLRLKEILHQYISNAARHTEQGFVRVGWQVLPETNEVLIHVEDTGCGIAEKNRDKVFSLFWKEDEFASGVGIGLTLVKRYTELMGGRLYFRSREEGGCDFGVVFPAHLAHK